MCSGEHRSSLVCLAVPYRFLCFCELKQQPSNIRLPIFSYLRVFFAAYTTLGVWESIYECLFASLSFDFYRFHFRLLTVTFFYFFSPIARSTALSSNSVLISKELSAFVSLECALPTCLRKNASAPLSAPPFTLYCPFMGLFYSSKPKINEPNSQIRSFNVHVGSFYSNLKMFHNK